MRTGLSSTAQRLGATLLRAALVLFVAAVMALPARASTATGPAPSVSAHAEVAALRVALLVDESAVEEAEVDPPERLSSAEGGEPIRFPGTGVDLATLAKAPPSGVDWPPTVVLVTRLEIARAARGPPLR